MAAEHSQRYNTPTTHTKYNAIHELHITVFARLDSMATIYFIMRFCVATIQERRLLSLGWKMKKSTASRKVEWLQMPGR